MIHAARTLWRYRHFLVSSVHTELRTRVARSRLGFLWLVIPPLSQVAIYIFVLSAIMTQRLPGIESGYAYAIYLISGFQAWLLFSEIVGRMTDMFLQNANYLKKISFPRMMIPLVIIVTALINNLIFLAIVLIIFLLIGHEISLSLLYLPAAIAINVVLAASLGTLLGLINVFIRDIGQLTAVGLQYLFWLTPIIYVVDIIPQQFVFLIELNPLYHLIELYHDILSYNVPPNGLAMLGLLALGLAASFAAVWVFRRAAPDMVDVL